MKTRGSISDIERRKDISLEEEKRKIPVDCPKNVPLPSFKYITQHCTLNAYYPPRDREKIKGCDCIDSCDDSCNCIKLSSDWREILECNDGCKCDKSCKNRKVANSVMPKMYLKYGGVTHGFGVIANEVIRKGKFVAIYAGEVVEIKSFIDRVDSDYTFTVDSRVNKCTIEIDGTKKSNIARFFNHSCKSNLKTRIAYLGQNRMAYPAFFARRIINSGEELTIDYGDSYFSLKGTKCRCGECNDYTVL
jgi:hypothetical protein